MLSKRPTEDQLKDLYNKMDTMWEKSDYGNLEVLYETAYLKVCEARLQRHYNPIESVNILTTAIEIYDRVLRSCEDRVIEEGPKKMSDEEEKFQHRIVELRDIAEKSKLNTETLKQKLMGVIDKVLEKDIKREEFNNLIELTSEYGLKLQDIVNETFEGRITRDVRRLTNEIDQSFKAYDEWQTTV